LEEAVTSIFTAEVSQRYREGRTKTVATIKPMGEVQNEWNYVALKQTTFVDGKRP
jgi:hypothetical protein